LAITPPLAAGSDRFYRAALGRMTTIAHISDLHFGRLDAPVAAALREELCSRRPGIIIVSGDLTQRGRVGQFAEAAEYLRQLPTPQVIVAGNHDVPLFNLIRRFLSPLGRFRKIVEPVAFPEFRSDSVYVLGLNTAHPFTITSGWLTRRQLAEARRRLDAQPAGMLTILVTHHPFIAPPDRPDADVLIHGPAALAELEKSRVDIVLAGHLHLTYHDDVIARFPELRRSTLSIQAGTACSTRRRSQPNAYNWITWDGGNQRLVSTARAWNGSAFADAAAATYRRSDDGWICEGVS
jgi:3',5'-cyclic AMP phosphodiesterase CpdA